MNILKKYKLTGHKTGLWNNRYHYNIILNDELKYDLFFEKQAIYLREIRILSN
jgi:hypothetical protein